jgi:S-phase kinase-associated protein 1
MVDDGEAEEEVQLMKVDAKVMQKVMEFLEYLKDNPEPTISKPITTGDIHDFTETWYADFIDLEDHNLVLDIISAANYLDIKPLLDLAAAKAATLIKVREVEDIRQLFGIQNDFTPEEEQKIIDENEWARSNF